MTLIWPITPYQASTGNQEIDTITLVKELHLMDQDHMNATYSRLESGVWGIRLHGEAQPGQQVVVTKRSGESNREVIGRVLWKHQGICLCTIHQHLRSPYQQPLALDSPEQE